jgi:hypothetical protein
MANGFAVEGEAAEQDAAAAGEFVNTLPEDVPGGASSFEPASRESRKSWIAASVMAVRKFSGPHAASAQSASNQDFMVTLPWKKRCKCLVKSAKILI